MSPDEVFAQVSGRFCLCHAAEQRQCARALRRAARPRLLRDLTAGTVVPSSCPGYEDVIGHITQHCRGCMHSDSRRRWTHCLSFLPRAETRLFSVGLGHKAVEETIDQRYRSVPSYERVNSKSEVKAASCGTRTTGPRLLQPNLYRPSAELPRHKSAGCVPARDSGSEG